MTRVVFAIAVLVLVLAMAAACVDRDAAAQPIIVAGPEVQGGEWFKQTGCTACHSVSVYRIWNLAAIGPDLSQAVEDVPRRFGVPLDEFLQAPTGTMSMVLSTRIPLTAGQRLVAIAKLKEAYRAQQDAAGLVRPLASH